MKNYIKYEQGRLRFFKPRNERITPVRKCMRHEYTGGCIFRGQLRVCDYRAPTIFDGNLAFRKTMGSKAELLRMRFHTWWMNAQQE